MPLRHAVLGFLSLRALTGYDLKKHFDASVRHFWSADQAQIYRALAQLAADELVEVEVIGQEGKPDRREHRITEAGLAELDQWLRAPLAPQPPREPFLMKVFFAGRLPGAEVVALLDARIDAAEAQLAVLRDVALGAAAALDGAPRSVDRLLATATLENGLRHVHAELDWLRDLRADFDDPSAAARRLRARLESCQSRGERA